jgi:hypothetical protein
MGYTSERVVISHDGRKVNAFYPIVWAFYADGRILGVIILSAVSGYLITLAYWYWITQSNLYALTYLIYLMCAILVSLLAYQANTGFWLILATIFTNQKLIPCSQS